MIFLSPSIIIESFNWLFDATPETLTCKSETLGGKEGPKGLNIEALGGSTNLVRLSIALSPTARVCLKNLLAAWVFYSPKEPFQVGGGSESDIANARHFVEWGTGAGTPDFLQFVFHEDDEDLVSFLALDQKGQESQTLLLVREIIEALREPLIGPVEALAA